MQLLAYLRDQLNSCHSSAGYDIAYSGGLDSHVLLHALAQIREQIPGLVLRAVHVHHGLSPYADDWVRHCREVCAGLRLAFRCEYIQAAPQPGESVEAWAREKRYAIFAKRLMNDAVLLTAHTQDDQAETLLLQLLRGAGPKGLAAMPACQSFHSGRLLRPFLDLSRRQLQDYARLQSLCWIEDASNQDSRFDRNFIRHQVMPILRQRWPAAAKNLSRSALHCAEADSNAGELALIDLGGEYPENLPIDLLRSLSPRRQRNALRHWLSSLSCQMPNTRHTQIIQRDLINGRHDSRAEFNWGKWRIRRHRQYLMVESVKNPLTIAQRIAWDLSNPLQLPGGLGELFARPQQSGGGISLKIDAARLSIGFRRGGERCRLPGRKHSTSLKKLFQEWRTPPWQRSRIPLLYYENELIAVIGYMISAQFCAAAGEPGWEITLKTR